MSESSHPGGWGSHARRSAALVLLAAAAIGLWQNGGWHGAATRDVACPGSAPPAMDPAGTPAPPSLVGRVRPRPRPGAREETAEGRPVGTAEEEDAASPVGPVGAGVVPTVGNDGSVLVGFSALAPSAIDDRVAPAAPSPLPLARSYVVGTVGPYGLRDAASAGAWTWAGVAQVERDDRAASESADDTKEPATTAVRGLVVGEDGRGIPGAEVILYSSFYLRQAFYDHRVRQIGRVFSDAAGAFDLRPIALDTVHFGAGGDVLVTVRHAGHAALVAQPLRGVVPGEESDVGSLLLPQRGATLRGVVRDLAGRPVVGAIVRVSGAFIPTEYDKTERMVVLDACPAAVTDADGRYELTGFASGDHEVSIHVHIDCVVHGKAHWEGDCTWSPQVLAGNGVRGRVVDPAGEPVAAAVVAGGGNWTPTNADGTFWLDNVQAGPLTLEVAHHAWHTKYVPGVPTNGDEVTIALEARLSRVTLSVVDAANAPVPVVAIDWTWPAGGGPGRFAPDSRYWQDPRGVFAVTVPEGSVGATLSDAKGASHALTPPELVDGTASTVTILPPTPAK